MIEPRMNGSSTALAQNTKAKNKTELTAKNTTRGRVQPPAGRPNGGVFRLAGFDTTPPNPGHNVDVPATQELATALTAVRARSGSLAFAAGPRGTHKTNRARVGDFWSLTQARWFVTESRVRSQTSSTRPIQIS